MNSENRNAFVVIALVVSMSAGVLLLQAMEPRSVRYAPSPSALMAGRSNPINSVTVIFVTDTSAVEPSDFDGIVTADAKRTWDPKRSDVRIAVYAGRGGAFPDARKSELLKLLAGIAADTGQVSIRVALEAPSPDELRSAPNGKLLVDELGELRTWLQIKDFLL